MINLPIPSQAMLERYNTSGPRYTSYPTAPIWTEDFGPDAYACALQQPKRALSLYVHLPFCEARCLFCSCNVIITQQRDQAEKYLGYLFREIDHVYSQIEGQAPAPLQLHWGGGTPTYLSCEQIERLYRKLNDRFELAPNAEVAIEVDPRVTTEDQLALLKQLGFNRISLGVQDVNPEVQEAIHRIQPEAQTARMIAYCRELGFGGINIDLIYGLPHQSVDSFRHTLEAVLRLDPDRIALYNYAHVPWMSPHQTAIDETTLPIGSEKFQIFRLALQTLTDAGYVYIGMDHFAKPTDELTIAQSEGRLHRNFMGYTVHGGIWASPLITSPLALREGQVGETSLDVSRVRGEAFGKRETESYLTPTLSLKGEGVTVESVGMDLIGLGVSAISGLENYYAQNQRKLSRYYEAIDAGQFPTLRGIALTEEDHRRRAVINGILCNGTVHWPSLNRRFGLDLREHFASPLAQLTPMVEDGLLTLTLEALTLTPLGRIFSRNIAMPFDAYLKPAGETPGKTGFSKTL